MPLWEFPAVPDEPPIGKKPYFVGIRSNFSVSLLSSLNEVGYLDKILDRKVLLTVTSALSDLSNVALNVGFPNTVSEDPDGRLWLFYTSAQSVAFGSGTDSRYYLLRLLPRVPARDITITMNYTGFIPGYDYSTGWMGTGTFGLAGTCPPAMDPSGNVWIATYAGARRINAATGLVDVTVDWPSGQPEMWHINPVVLSNPGAADDSLLMAFTAGKSGLLFVARRFVPGYKQENSVAPLDPPVGTNAVYDWWFLPWAQATAPIPVWSHILSQSRDYYTTSETVPTAVINLDSGDHLETGAIDILAGIDFTGTAFRLFLFQINAVSDGFGGQYTNAGIPAANINLSGIPAQLGSVLWALGTLGIVGQGTTPIYQEYEKTLAQFIGDPFQVRVEWPEAQFPYGIVPMHPDRATRGIPQG